MCCTLLFKLYTSVSSAATWNHLAPLEFLSRFQYSLKWSVTNFQNVLNRTCGELPRAPLAKWAAIFFSLFVLTLQTSIAASQAFLAVAGILYVIHLVQARPAVLFLPVKLPLALFCILSLVSIFLGTNPTTGWFAFRKLVLFLIWLLAINLVVSTDHLRRLIQGLFLVSFVTSLVGIGQFVTQYRDVRAHHPGELYHYLTSTRIHGFMGHWMHFGGQQMLVFVFLVAFLLLSKTRNLKPESGNSTACTSSSKSGFRSSPFWWALVGIARPRCSLHSSEFHPWGLAGLLPGVDLPCDPMET
jgi:hypothetical protein